MARDSQIRKRFSALVQVTSRYAAETKIASICGGKEAYQRRFGGKISRKRGRRRVYRRRVVQDMSESSKETYVGCSECPKRREFGRNEGKLMCSYEARRQISRFTR